MTADLLRRAATVLRQHAQAAPEGPWESLSNGDRLLAIRYDEAPGYRYLVNEPVDEATAAYFALLHPPVALALAEMLDHVADDVSDAGDRVEPGGLARNEYGFIRFDWTAAVKLARAVLREPEESS